MSRRRPSWPRVAFVTTCAALGGWACLVWGPAATAPPAGGGDTVVVPCRVVETTHGPECRWEADARDLSDARVVILGPAPATSP